MKEDLLGSYGAAGLLGAANLGAYTAAVLVITARPPRADPSNVIKVGLAGSCAGLVLMTVATAPWMLLVGMCVLGACGALIWLPASGIVAATAPEERRGLAYGLMIMGVGLGITLSGLLTGAVQALRGEDAWREVWAAVTVIALLVLLTVGVAAARVGGTAHRAHTQLAGTAWRVPRGADLLVLRLLRHRLLDLRELPDRRPPGCGPEQCRGQPRVLAAGAGQHRERCARRTDFRPLAPQPHAGRGDRRHRALCGRDHRHHRHAAAHHRGRAVRPGHDRHRLGAGRLPQRRAAGGRGDHGAGGGHPGAWRGAVRRSPRWADGWPTPVAPSPRATSWRGWRPCWAASSRGHCRAAGARPASGRASTPCRGRS